MQNISPLPVFALFSIGLEAIVGLSLGLSDGLSETHKSVLVTFIVAFPALTLFLFVNVLPRLDGREGAPFRSRKSEVNPPPFEANLAKG